MTRIVFTPPRAREFLAMLASGRPRKDIAVHFGVTTGTVNARVQLLRARGELAPLSAENERFCDGGDDERPLYAAHDEHLTLLRDAYPGGIPTIKVRSSPMSVAVQNARRLERAERSGFTSTAALCAEGGF